MYLYVNAYKYVFFYMQVKKGKIRSNEFTLIFSNKHFI